VLDPRISYEGLKTDYADDPTLSKHLEHSKANLFNYFDENYATLSPMLSSPPPAPVQVLPVSGSPQKSFTARYRRKEKYSTNELEEYFKLPAEDFDTCNPIQWWVGRRHQFPRLYQMARDILCIPGQCFGSLIHDLDLNYLLQAPLLPLKEFSRVGGIPFLSDVRVSKRTQFVSSCLSRSGSISTMPGPKLPSIIRAAHTIWATCTPSPGIANTCHHVLKLCSPLGRCAYSHPTIPSTTATTSWSHARLGPLVV